MKAFLHIGTEKTGTTTIQHFLAKNRKFLLEDGFFYPRSLGQQNHVKLAVYAMAINKVQDRQRLGITEPEKVIQFRDKCQKNLAEELNNTKTNKVILSNEHCSSRLVSIEEIELLKSFLGKFFEDIKIIIYLRRQDKFLLSTYSTAVKCGYTRRFSIPSEQVIKKRYDYWNILKKWESVFGKENIVVKVFERNQMLEGNLFKDFTNILGININNRYQITPILNESLDIYCLEFLRLVNYYIPVCIGNKINQKRCNIIKSLVNYSKYHSDNNYLGIEKEPLDSFMSLFEESNKRVANYFLACSDGKLFTEYFHNENKTPMKSLTIKKAFEIFAYLIEERLDSRIRSFRLKSKLKQLN